MKTCRTCKNHHDIQHFGHWCYAVGVPVDPNQNRNKCCDYIEDENICVTCGHKMIGTIYKGKQILGCTECGNYENLENENENENENKTIFCKSPYFFIGCALIVSGTLSYINNHALLGIGLISIAISLPIFYNIKR